MPQKTLTMLVLILFGIVTTGCDTTTQTGGTRHYIFVDRSASVTPGQRAHWKTATANVFDKVERGDSIAIYPLHANTLAAAAAFSGTSRPVDDGAPHDEVEQANAEFEAMITGAYSGLEHLLSDSEPSIETDIFSLVDRLPTTGNSSASVIILSDMLHSSRRDIDLERIAIKPGAFQALFQRIADQHHWSRATLAGATVTCVLPPLDGKVRHEVNDRRVLKDFWAALIHALGGRLAGFDTQI